MWEEPRLRVFENRVLRRVFGHKGGEVTGEWRKLHNDEHYELYSSPNVIWAIKKNEMGGTCSTYRREVHTGIWWGNVEERDHMEDLITDKRMILK